MRTLVIQSCNTAAISNWIQACLDSVVTWCQAHGHERRLVDDSIFDRVPDWYLAKTGKGPVAADYGRLLLLQEALDREGFHQAIWLDADVFVMDPGMILDTTKTCAFGQEVWIQTDKGKLQARNNVHNAVCLFRQGCVVLPFLAATVASIIRRADARHIAPQMVGPKLLTALHSLYEFDLLPQVGAVSPALAGDLVRGGGPALDLFLGSTAVPLQAVNLCASLIRDAEAEKVIRSLSLLA